MDNDRNLLGDATSPYLLQHAENPVHWRPWGPEALAEAKRRDCPILLSIGYAACHWCHVMAHESFENARNRQSDERAVRQCEGRSRRAARHRSHLYDRAARAGAAGRLAADHVPRSRRQADVRRHLLAARAALGPSVVPADSRVGRRRLAHPPGKDGETRRGARGPSGRAFGAEPRPRARRPTT